MGVRNTPTDTAAARDSFLKAVDRAQKAATTATPAMAQGMVVDSQQYPWLNPKIIAALNMSGASESARQVAAYAAAVGGMRKGDAFLEPPAPAKKKKGFWDKLGPVSWVGRKVGDAGAWTGDHLPGWVRAPVKGASRYTTAALSAPYQVLQNNLGRNVLDPMADTFGDIVHGRLQDLPKDLGRQAWGSVKTLGNPLGTPLGMPKKNANGRYVDPSFDATDLGQMIQHGDKSGSGFFAGEGIQKLTGEAAQRVRGTDPGGHAWTIGRFVTAPLPQDSAVHKYVSGAIDMYSALALDPVNIIGAGLAGDAAKVGAVGMKAQGPVGAAIIRAGREAKAAQVARVTEVLDGARTAARSASEFRAIAEETAAAGAHAHAAESLTHAQAWAQKAKQLVDEAESVDGITERIAKVQAKDPDWVQTVRNAAGLVEGPKGQKVIEGSTFKWLLSKDGQNVVETLRNVDSPTVIRRMYAGKISNEAAVALADADTPEAVIKALGGAIELKPGTSNRLRSLDPVRGAGRAARRENLGDKVPELARAMGWKPKGTWLDFSDADKAVDTLYDVLGNVKIVGPERTELVDRWARAMATGDRATMYQLGKETNGRLAQTLIDAGMSRAEAAKITTSFYKDSDRMRAYASFDLASQVPGTFLSGKKGNNGILRVSQILDGGWGLMDTDALNKVRIQTSRTVKLLGPESSRRRLPITAINWFQDTLFKPSAVLRPALMFRLLPDEAMRIYAGGHLSDSGSVLTAVLNHPKTSAMGELFDAPGELLKLNKSIGKLEKGTEAVADIAVGHLKAGEVGELVAKHPEKMDAINAIAAEHSKLADLERKLVAGDSLTSEEAKLVEDLADFHGGDSALDALSEQLGSLEGRMARTVVDNPELADLYERKNILERQFARKQSGITEVLTGSRGNGTIAKMFEGGVNDSVLYRSGSRVIVNKNDARFVEMYRNGLADEIISMASDPVYRRIAHGGLLRGDKIHAEPGGVRGVVDEYTARHEEIASQLREVAGRRQTAEQAVADLQATHDAKISELTARRDAIMDARDSGRKAVTKVQAEVDDLNRQIAELVDGGAQPGAIRAARRELLEKQKDLRWTKRIEAGEIPDMGIADHRAELAKVRKDIADARKAAKAELKKAGVPLEQLDREQMLIERRVAKVDAAFKRGLLDGDGYTHLGDEPTTLDHVKGWLLNGNGREYAEKFARASGNTLNEKFVSDWVDLMAKDIETVWGHNAEARGAIVTGKLRGETIAEAQRQWGPRRGFSDTLRSWADEFAGTAEAPAQIRYEPSLEEARRYKMPGALKTAEQRRRVTDKAFAWMYGNQSDKFIRIPEYSRSYWSNIEELITQLEPDEAARLVENAAEAGLTDSQLNRIKTLAGSARGEGLLEDADRLAHGYALDDVKKLLFDMERVNQFQDMTRLLFPFGRAWYEVISTWSKIALDADTVAGKVGRVAQLDHAAQKGITAARGAGAFYTDENGQEVFNYPLSGALGTMFAGAFAPGSAATASTMFRGKVAGLSIGTQMLPGIGPVIALPTYEITKHLPIPNAVVEAVFPFGKPESLAGTVLPAWFEKLQSSWNADEHEQIYGNTLFEAARGLAATGKYGFDADGREKLMRDARRQAQALTMLRGLTQAVVPSAPIPVYEIEAAGGDVTTVKLAQELSKMYADPDAAKEKYGVQSVPEAFIAEFGPQAVYYLWGKTKTVSGGETASEQFSRWQESNKDLAAKYPNVFGYFGPQTAGYSQTVAQRQIEMGTRVKRTANEVLALANAKIADLIYYGVKDEIMADNRRLGVNRLTQEQSQWLAERRAELEEQFPGWDTEARSAESRARLERQIGQLRVAATDPKVAETPTGRNLRQYMIWRAQVVDEATKREVTGWGTANATVDLRQWLAGKAATLAAKDPGFASLFDDVLSREMKD